MTFYNKIRFLEFISHNCLYVLLLIPHDCDLFWARIKKVYVAYRSCLFLKQLPKFKWKTVNEKWGYGYTVHILNLRSVITNLIELSDIILQPNPKYGLHAMMHVWLEYFRSISPHRWTLGTNTTENPNFSSNCF